MQKNMPVSLVLHTRTSTMTLANGSHCSLACRVLARAWLDNWQGRFALLWTHTTVTNFSSIHRSPRHRCTKKSAREWNVRIMFMDMIRLLLTPALSGSFRTWNDGHYDDDDDDYHQRCTIETSSSSPLVIGERENGNVFLIILSLSHAHSRLALVIMKADRSVYRINDRPSHSPLLFFD